MNLPTEIFGSVIVVHAPEELTDDHAQAFESFVTSLERSQVILDLDPTEALDSRGLESLLSAREVLQHLDGDIKISTTLKMNRKILEITRLDHDLEIFDSVIDAVKSYA
jgi:anti-anti-sigma factor